MSVVFILLVSYLLSVKDRRHKTKLKMTDTLQNMSFKHDNTPHVFENKNMLYLIYLLDATYLYIQVIPEMMLKSNVKPK